MPEGDNLFRAATALRKALQGSRVAAFHSDVPLLLRAREAEALFLCGQDPFRAVSAVPDAQLVRLVAEAHRLLVANREAGPRTSRNALTGPRLWVYGRSGKPCLKCGSPIRMRRQGATGRSTYYCPRCQGVPS